MKKAQHLNSLNMFFTPICYHRLHCRYILSYRSQKQNIKKLDTRYIKEEESTEGEER